MEYDIDRVIEEYSAKILAKVCSCIPESDVEDVTQDILLAVWLGLEKFKGNSSIGTWIYRITTCKIADWHRERARTIEHRYESEAVNVTLANDGAHSSADSYGDFIPDMVTEMPEKYARTVHQFFVQGMTYSEIAKAENLTYEATRSRCRQVVHYIREHELVERI